MRRRVVVGLAVLLVVFGFWLGERGAPPWHLTNIGSAIIAILLVVVLITARMWTKLIAGVIFLGIYAGAFYTGWLSFTGAYKECVENGEEVRDQLKEYYQKNHQYPEHLSQLPTEMMCVRISRPTILNYERTKSGYVLSFKDWLVVNRATESESFIAHK